MCSVDPIITVALTDLSITTNMMSSLLLIHKTFEIYYRNVDGNV